MNCSQTKSLYKAVKFLMLNRAIGLHDDKGKGKKVRFFSVPLFARHTSNDPEQLLRNHLNQAGHQVALNRLKCPSSPLLFATAPRGYPLSMYHTEVFDTIYTTDTPRPQGLATGATHS